MRIACPHVPIPEALVGGFHRQSQRFFGLSQVVLVPLALGEGYPSGLVRDAIPESARIVSIVDVYDALTHDRVYRPALPEEEALQMIQQGAGTQFDPLLLAAFFSQFSEISRVALENPDEAADAESVGVCPTEACSCGELGMMELASTCTS